jgi:hypothetical protein
MITKLFSPIKSFINNKFIFLIKHYIKIILKHKYKSFFTNLNTLDINVQYLDKHILIKLTKLELNIHGLNNIISYELFDSIILEEGIIIKIPFDELPHLKINETIITINNVHVKIKSIIGVIKKTQVIDSESDDDNNIDIMDDFSLKTIEEYVEQIVNNMKLTITNINISHKNSKCNIVMADIVELSTILLHEINYKLNDIEIITIPNIVLSNTLISFNTIYVNLKNYNYMDTFIKYVYKLYNNLIELFNSDKKSDISLVIDKLELSYCNLYKITVYNISLINSYIHIYRITTYISNIKLLSISTIKFNNKNMHINLIKYNIRRNITIMSLINDIIEVTKQFSDNRRYSMESELSDIDVYDNHFDKDISIQNDFVIISSDTLQEINHDFIINTIYKLHIYNININIIDEQNNIKIDIKKLNFINQSKYLNNALVTDEFILKISNITVYDNVKQSLWNKLLYCTYETINMITINLTNINDIINSTELSVDVEPFTVNLDQHTLDHMLYVFNIDKQSPVDEDVEYSENINRCHINNTQITISYKPLAVDVNKLIHMDYTEIGKIGVIRDLEINLNEHTIYDNTIKTLFNSIIDKWIYDIKTHNFNKCVFSIEPLKYMYQLNNDVYNVVSDKHIKHNVGKLMKNTTANVIDISSKTLISLQTTLELLYGKQKTAKMANYPTNLSDGLSKAHESMYSHYDKISNNVSLGSIVIHPIIGVLESTTKILLGLHSSISKESARRRSSRYKN